MKAFLLPLILALPGFALAMGDSGTSEPKTDPVLEKVTAATKKQDWASAQAMLREALAANPQNANYHNMFAYSVRKGANPDMNVVFKHYNEALRLDPKLKGAHEYIGEAYLQVGNVAKAKEHLAQLDKLCFFSCSEYTELKKAIADYEAKR